MERLEISKSHRIEREMGLTERRPRRLPSKFVQIVRAEVRRYRKGVSHELLDEAGEKNRTKVAVSDTVKWERITVTIIMVYLEFVSFMG
jgi:hypothetical protein